MKPCKKKSERGIANNRVSPSSEGVKGMPLQPFKILSSPLPSDLQCPI